MKIYDTTIKKYLDQCIDIFPIKLLSKLFLKINNNFYKVVDLV